MTTGLSLSALVSGQSFLVRWNHTNTGAATLAVDGLVAVAINRPSNVALVAGDATANAYARIAYNGTAFQIVASFSDGARLGAVQNFTQAQTIVTSGINLTLESSGNPTLRFNATAQAADEKLWRVDISAGDFRFSTRTDADVLGTQAVLMQRTGTTVDEIELNATLFDLNGVLDLSSTLELGHPTDTTLARIAAGRVSIEGVEIDTASNTLTLTNKTLTTPTINGAALSGTLSGSPAFSGGPTLANSGPTSVDEIGFRGAPVNTQNAAYQFVLADAGKTIYHDEVTARTYTIPDNATVAFPIGTTIIIDNTGNGGGAPGTITVAIAGTDVLRRGDGTAGTGSRTIAANAGAMITKTKATEWSISGTFT